MDSMIQQLLRRNLFEVFGERDPERRRAAIEAIFAPTATFDDPEGSHAGWGAIDRSAAALQAATPGFVFTLVAEPEVAGDAGRLRWTYGAPGQASSDAGTDIAIVADGRITAMYTFFDPPA